VWDTQSLFQIIELRLLLIFLLCEKVKENFILQIFLMAYRLEHTNIVYRKKFLQGKAVKSSVTPLLVAELCTGNASWASLCYEGILSSAMRPRKKSDED